MKIIAQISEGKVLVEMTAQEVANVTGRDYKSELADAASSRAHRHMTGLEVGTEHAISPAWQRLREQEGAAQKLEGVSKTLAALSDLVTQTKVQLVNCTASTEGQQ